MLFLEGPSQVLDVKKMLNIQWFLLHLFLFQSYNGEKVRNSEPITVSQCRLVKKVMEIGIDGERFNIGSFK